MTRTRRGRLLAAAAAAALWAVAPTAHASRPQVTVTRDSAGIPHIVARDFGSLGYGEGYSYAQDNLCTFAETVVTLRAERSKYFGPDEPTFQWAGGAVDANWKSDLFWQRIRDARIVEKAVAQRPPLGPDRDTRALYRGWAEGYNAFLASGRLRDPRCKGKPWVKPITALDLFFRGEQIATTPSSSNFISGIVDAQPPAPAPRARAATARPDPSALRRLLGDPAETPAGSNGVGLGAEGTKAGTGMVLANPHFPWRGPERFWMAHLTVPGSYDVLGGTLAGFPPVGIGFNKDVAWTSTVSTARRFVIFQLKLVPGDPTSYVVDGKPEKMTAERVTAAGRSHIFYRTRYGVVFNLPAAGYGWTSDTAYALRDVQEGNLRAASQYLAMGRARSVGELLSAQQRYLGIPTFNVLAADRHGDALYSDVGAIPNVSQAKIDACLPEGAARLVFAAARVVTLDGSRSQCALRNDADAVAPEIFGPAHLPKIVRRDYVENSNDSYWLANPRRPLTGFSPIIGLEGTPQNQRTRQGNLMIQPLLGRFTLGRLQRMWANDRNYSAEVTAAQLAAACTAAPSVTLADGSAVDVSAACPALAAYGRTGNLDDPGAWLFNEWLRRAPAFNGPLFSDRFDPARPFETPSVLNTGNAAVLQALGAAVKSLRAHNVALDATLRQTQYAPQSRDIPIHGCFQCFQYIQAANETLTPLAGIGPYGQVTYGSSLVMTTELRRQGPRSEAIVTYSQASDPTSPWYANMTRLFSRKHFVPMRFTRRALAHDRGARRVNIPGATRAHGT